MHVLLNDSILKSILKLTLHEIDHCIALPKLTFCTVLPVLGGRSLSKR